MVHLISGMQFVMGINEAPRQASAMGGIYRWKDGRNMPDMHTVLFQYGETPVYVRLGLGCANAGDHAFMGSKGTLEYRGGSVKYYAAAGRGYGTQLLLQLVPGEDASRIPEEWHAEHDSMPGNETVEEGISVHQRRLRRFVAAHVEVYSKRCGRASRWCRMRCSATMRRWPATWRMNRTSAKRGWLGTRRRERSSQLGEQAA